MQIDFRATLIAVTFAAFATPALADRDPTPEERARIEAKLAAEGYARWDDIELEDDRPVWEVDDAVWSDGREYDLELAADTLEILKKDPD
ncbi:MAG: PepSY domain-containing protein [Rhizobiaceae bacterium]